MSVLSIKKLRDNAIIPTFSVSQQFSLYIPEDITLLPNKVHPIALGIQTSFPTNYAALIVENGCVNTLGGLIDSDYRGEIHLLASSEKELKLTRGQAVASLLILQIEHPIIENDEALSDSNSEDDCDMSLSK